MKRSTTWCVLVSLWIAGCAKPAPAPEPAAPVPTPKPAASESVTPLIPRDVLFGNPDRAWPVLSPDGKSLAFLQPENGVLNVWVAPVGKLDQAKAVTHDRGRGIYDYHWAYTNKHILYLQDKDGDENDKVFVVDITTGKEKVLTPFDEILGRDGKPLTGPDGKPLRPKAMIVEVSPKFPNEILIGLNQRNPSFHDIFRLDIKSGAMRRVLQNDEFSSVVTDRDLRARLGLRPLPEGGYELVDISTAKAPKTLAKVDLEDVITTHPLTLDSTGRVLYLQDSRKRDTAALVSVELASGKTHVLAEDAGVDLSEVLVHPTRLQPQAVGFERARLEWKALDASVASDVKAISAIGDGDWRVISRSLDDKRWIVSFEVDDGPRRFYLYERATKKPTFLFANRSRLESAKLAKRHPVTIQSRDGLGLVSYYTLPLDADPTGSGKVAKPLPTVLWVHGGPWYRDSWGYEPIHQWMANRGYAVLSVNYRGSTGFGKTFVNAGNREWAGKMHEDLLDAVAWAVKEGIADPERVCITGGSYGGFATLVGLTFTPKTFACGVDIVGPSNLVTFMQTLPPYWQPEVEEMRKRIGDERTEEGKAFLTSRSPISRVADIERPLLIGQGANDPRVKQAESDQIVNAMLGKKIPVTYLLYPDEGHGFQRPENQLSFFAVMEAFLSKHLDGRFEPIGDAFAGSSVEVLEGRALVPGLADVKSARPKKD